jgi:hypothetical protein
MSHLTGRAPRAAVIALLTVGASAFIIGLGVAHATQAETDAPTRAVSGVASASDSALWMEMRNVDLRIVEHGALRIERLRGEIVATTPGEPAVLDDTHSFSVRVTSGTVAMTGDDLGALLNGYVFAYPGAPLKHLRVRMDGSQIALRGVLHKGVDLRFEITATPSLEPDGRVRLHPTRTRILGVNGQKLLRALGMHLDDILDLRKSRGASVRGDDLYLDPMQIIPPPAMSGRLASIRVEEERVVQEFVRLPEDSLCEAYVRAGSSVANLVYFRGGKLRFGKLLMSDTDLQIVDADQSDPFDLYLDQYARQLVAGTSRTLANMGLRVLMPDYAAVAGGATLTAARANLPR